MGLLAPPRDGRRGSASCGTPPGGSESTPATSWGCNARAGLATGLGAVLGVNSPGRVGWAEPLERPSPRETVTSYEGYDFRRLWAGRDAVTRLESELVRSALVPGPATRLLEAGTGFGRLSPVLASLSKEYVGVDLDPTALPQVAERIAAAGRTAAQLLANANLFHLPFASSSFDFVVSIRVYHHIRNPSEFLAELARVLAPGGTLLLSYTPKPSVATLAFDLRAFLRAEAAGLTWDRSDTSEYASRPYPIVVPTAVRVRQDVRNAGFEVVREIGEGPERLAAWLPLRSDGRAASKFPTSYAFPIRFLIARRTAGAPRAVSPLAESLTCPRCQTPIPPRGPAEAWQFDCPRCAHRTEFRDRTLFAVYIPSDAERRTSDVGASSTVAPDPAPVSAFPPEVGPQPGHGAS